MTTKEFERKLKEYGYIIKETYSDILVYQQTVVGYEERLVSRIYKHSRGCVDTLNFDYTIVEEEVLDLVFKYSMTSPDER